MRHDQTNTGASPLPAVYRGGRPWSFATGRGLFITPVVGGDGAVYFGSADNNFYALNPNGTLRWKYTTGNIIDAAAAISPSQRAVTIGSADETLYDFSTSPKRLTARRRVLWRYHATLRPAGGQLVDWWECDIAYGPDGNLYTGNTGGVIYSFTPKGRLRWTYATGQSVWTMPAFGPGGSTFWGSVDRNVYSLSTSGAHRWTQPTLGFVIASPAIGSDGTVYVGSFDSKLYALDPATGLTKWSFGTNDSIYSSPALGHDAQGNTDAIYIASSDGTIDKLSPQGKLIWAYDTGEPIRSSPVLGASPTGAADAILYVGSSDGSLYAIDTATGQRRWSYDTVSNDPILHDRHELNSSPALSRTGVYIGSEDGHLTYVPYDYCLHHPDPRCDTDPGAPYPATMSRVVPVTAGGEPQLGGTEGPVPASTEITGRLIVRHGGSTTYAAMLPVPSTTALVHSSPPFTGSAELSGDGRYVFLEPDSMLAPDTTYHVTVSGTWGADGTRAADYTVPGTWTKFGPFGDTFTFHTATAGGPLPLAVTPRAVTGFEIRRLAVPLPAFLPSVNQIGFDSYILLAAPISITPPGANGIGQILLWATQARRGPHGTYLADPHGTLTFPLQGQYEGSTLKLAVHNATLTFSFGQVPVQNLDLGVKLNPSLTNAPGASIYASAVCADIPNYSVATYITGICNAPDGVLAAAGTFVTSPYHAVARPPGLTVAGVTLVRPTETTAGSLTARFALRPGARYPAADHRIGLLLVDPATGQPLGLDYTAQQSTTDAHGNVASATLSIPAGTSVPAQVRAYVIADVFPLLSETL